MADQGQEEGELQPAPRISQELDPAAAGPSKATAEATQGPAAAAAAAAAAAQGPTRSNDSQLPAQDPAVAAPVEADSLAEQQPGQAAASGGEGSNAASEDDKRGRTLHRHRRHRRRDHAHSRQLREGEAEGEQGGPPKPRKRSRSDSEHRRGGGRRTTRSRLGDSNGQELRTVHEGDDASGSSSPQQQQDQQQQQEPQQQPQEQTHEQQHAQQPQQHEQAQEQQQQRPLPPPQHATSMDAHQPMDVPAPENGTQQQQVAQATDGSMPASAQANQPSHKHHSKSHRRHRSSSRHHKPKRHRSRHRSGSPAHYGQQRESRARGRSRSHDRGDPQGGRQRSSSRGRSRSPEGLHGPRKGSGATAALACADRERQRDVSKGTHNLDTAPYGSAKEAGGTAGQHSTHLNGVGADNGAVWVGERRRRSRSPPAGPRHSPRHSPWRSRSPPNAKQQHSSQSPPHPRRSRSPAPRKRSRSPGRRPRSPSPQRKPGSHSPARKRSSEPPARRRSHSPARKRSNEPPARRRSRSPPRKRSSEPPARRLSRSPRGRRSASTPDRKRPRSPGRARSRSRDAKRRSRSPRGAGTGTGNGAAAAGRRVSPDVRARRRSSSPPAYRPPEPQQAAGQSHARSEEREKEAEDAGAGKARASNGVGNGAAPKGPGERGALQGRAVSGQLKGQANGQQQKVKLSFEDELDEEQEGLQPRARATAAAPEHQPGNRQGPRGHTAIVTPASKQGPTIMRAVVADSDAQLAPSLLRNPQHPRTGASAPAVPLDGVDMHAVLKKLAAAAAATQVPAGAAAGYGMVQAGRTGNIVLAGEEDSSSSGLHDSSDELSSGGRGNGSKAAPGRLGRVVFGVAQARCTRPYMEDRHVCVSCWRPLAANGRPVDDGVERSYAAVFDGHNGERCAEVAAAKLHLALAAEPVFRTFTGELGPPASVATEQASITLAIRRTFQALDDELLRQAAADGGRDGATALVLLRLADTLYVAHLGDSRAVLCRPRAVAQALTRDHKPNLPEERARVEAAGGRVELQRCWRVIVEPTNTRPGSGLAVSRSLGDIDFKQPLRLVDSTPEVARYVPKPGDAFVILASDGLWDVMSDQEAVDVVYNSLQACKGVPSTAQVTAAAEAALAMAVRRGTLDNVTVLVMALTWGSAG